MARIIVEHEKYGKVLFDTKTQKYETVSPFAKVNNNLGENKIFSYGNKKAFYFDTYKDFLESNIHQGVVPVVCVEAKQHKRRFFVELMDANNYNFKFFNVEMIESKWHHNKVTNIWKNKCYFTLLERDEKAVNDCILISTLLIKKGMTNATP